MKAVLRFVSLLGFMLMPVTASAWTQPRDAVEGLSGLSVPRYTSLSSGLANMRTGPGERYPVKYVYKRKGLPLRVINEYGIWREVVDPDGDGGWMHRNMLTGGRTAIVMGDIQTLRARPNESAKAAWQVEPGVIGALSDCSGSWCRFTVEKRSGYIRYNAIWGIDPNESFE